MDREHHGGEGFDVGWRVGALTFWASIFADVFVARLYGVLA